MGLEAVQELPLPDVKDAHAALPASGDEQLLLGRVLQHGGAVVMTREACRGKRWQLSPTSAL